MGILDDSKRLIPFKGTITLKDIEKAMLDVGFRNDNPGFIPITSSFTKKMYEEVIKEIKEHSIHINYEKVNRFTKENSL